MTSIQHKLFWGSSYVVNLSYHLLQYIYDKNNLRPMRKRIRNLQSMVKIQTSVLLKKMQIRMEQNSERILEREENANVCKKKDERESRRCFRFKEPTMERWANNRQVGLYSYLETEASLLRLSWICSRTSTSYGRLSGAYT